MRPVRLVREDRATAKEAVDDLRGRQAMLARLHRRETPSARERKGQQQLVLQIGPRKGARSDVARHPPGSLLRKGFRRYTQLAEATDDFGDVFEHGFDEEYVA